MSQNEHNSAIINQFTKQAIPFSLMLGHAHALAIMIEMAKPSSRDTVLDVACGPGIVACAFAEKTGHVTGIDITPAMIERAKEVQREKNLDNITWQVGGVEPLPFPDNSFSIVLTRYTFHHFLDPAAVFAEMKRVCKPGGTLMVADASVPAAKQDAYDHVEKLKDPSHTHVRTPEELTAMAVKLELDDVRSRWYKVEMEVEAQLKGMFPAPGDDEKIREIYRKDIGRDEIGMDTHLVGHEIHFAYPVLVLAGKKEY